MFQLVRQKSTSKPRPKRYWEILFTIENPQTDALNFNSELVRYAIWKKEIGANGQPQIRGYIEFKKDTTEKKASEFLAPNVQYQKSMQFRDEARDEFRTGENRLAGPWEYGKWWENYDSKLEMLLKLIDKGIDEEEFKREHLRLYREYKSNIQHLIAKRDGKLDEYWESRQPVVTYSDPDDYNDSDFEADEWTVLDMLSNGMTKAQIKKNHPRLHRKFEYHIEKWFRWDKEEKEAERAAKKAKAAAACENVAPVNNKYKGLKIPTNNEPEAKSIIPKAPAKGPIMPKVPNNVVPPKDMPIVLPKEIPSSKNIPIASPNNIIVSPPNPSQQRPTFDEFMNQNSINDLLNLVKKYPINTDPKGSHIYSRCIPDKSLSGGSFPKKQRFMTFTWTEAIGSRKIEYSETTWLGGDVLPPKVEPVINFEGRDDYSDDSCGESSR